MGQNVRRKSSSKSPNEKSSPVTNRSLQTLAPEEETRCYEMSRCSSPLLYGARLAKGAGQSDRRRPRVRPEPPERAAPRWPVAMGRERLGRGSQRGQQLPPQRGGHHDQPRGGFPVHEQAEGGCRQAKVEW